MCVCVGAVWVVFCVANVHVCLVESWVGLEDQHVLGYVAGLVCQAM